MLELTEDEARRQFFRFCEGLEDCHKCRLYPRFVDYPVFRFRPVIAFVGHSPSLKRKEAGLTFGGRSKEVFEKLLETLKLRREDVYTTNIVKCTQPDCCVGELKHCNTYLWDELRLVQPGVVVLMGREVLSEVLGPVSFHRTYLKNGLAFIGLMHPCVVLYRAEFLEEYLSLARKVLAPYVAGRMTKLDEFF